MTDDPDFELRRLCAEAISLVALPRLIIVNNVVYKGAKIGEQVQQYNPLTNDHQAMELVKQFRVRVSHMGVHWYAALDTETWPAQGHDDLNRAIVECVAQMQRARNQ